MFKSGMVFAAVIAQPAMAQQFEDNAALAQSTGTAIDPRLRLARCPEAVSVEPGQGVVTIRCNSIGWRIRAVLRNTGTTEDSTLVRRNDSVEIVGRGDAFSVTTRGIAMEDGHAGQAIRVKSSTGAVTVATVNAPGRVSLTR